MVRGIFKALIISLCLACFQPALRAETIYSLDFSKLKDGKANFWLEENGFDFEKDADELTLLFKNGELLIETDEEIFGLLMKEVNIKNAKKIRIEWGIRQYPEGSDWSKDVLKEGVAVIVSFGDRKIDSGSWVVPNVPYFLALFLGELEKDGKAYLGNYWKKGGRYFCSPCGKPPGKTVVTEFEIHDRFKAEFDEKTVPPVTALSIEVDTRDTKGASKAFIKKIEFLSE